jgi:hypothetical protein
VGPTVTTSATGFAAALEALGNRNEVIILLKDPLEQPKAAEDLRRRGNAKTVVAVPQKAVQASARRRRGLANASDRARTEIELLVASHGLERTWYRTGG